MDNSIINADDVQVKYSYKHKDSNLHSIEVTYYGLADTYFFDVLEECGKIHIFRNIPSIDIESYLTLLSLLNKHEKHISDYIKSV